MDKSTISHPSNFEYKEGDAVDFSKTFDLSGLEEDEMLKVYLKKAGLSDDIKCLNPEQRRAFIYDIVKSNKNPGYWKPSILPHITKKAPINDDNVVEFESISDIIPAAMTSKFDFYLDLNKPKSKNSLNPSQSSQGISEAPWECYSSNSSSTSSPQLTSKYKRKKGQEVEISGPVNFQHIAGDMSRDMTRNAFDLSGDGSCNAMRKYIIEHNISEQDIVGIESKDLIKKIVHSKQTWSPNSNDNRYDFVPEVARQPDSMSRKSYCKTSSLIVQPQNIPYTKHTEEYTPVKSFTTTPDVMCLNVTDDYEDHKRPEAFTPSNEDLSKIPSPPNPPPIPDPPQDSPSIPISVLLKEQGEAPTSNTSAMDGRNDLLESIRAGVTLKKVNSGSSGSQDLDMTNRIDIPPNLPKTDFMSELKNATLKRLKKNECL